MGQTTSSPSTEEIDTKEARLANPSGWLHLTQHDSVPILIDALLDLPPRREFNKTEFAEHAGITPDSRELYHTPHRDEYRRTGAGYVTHPLPNGSE